MFLCVIHTCISPMGLLFLTCLKGLATHFPKLHNILPRSITFPGSLILHAHPGGRIFLWRRHEICEEKVHEEVEVRRWWHQRSHRWWRQRSTSHTQLFILRALRDNSVLHLQNFLNAWLAYSTIIFYSK